jgi:serine/threonine protein kinase/beta-lactam-binding protein with PASTA domain
MIENSKLLAKRYRLLEQIDSGGSAYIYKAMDEITKQIVAVKVLKPELTRNEEFVQRFKKEVQASLKLRHANIIRAYDAGLDREMYYIVMDLIEGKTLKHLININGPLPLKYVVSVAKKLCLALEYAHVKGFIHRDIKPHNVMIDMTGEPYIADFGIARNIAQSTITVEENNVMGSVHYFSPEQARGERADKRSDLYSLGILLYEMLTGKVPFDADAPVAIALKHINEQMPNVGDELSEAPESLNKIILKATQKDKHFRYKSAFAMYEDLQRCLLEPDGGYIRYTENKRVQQHMEETHLKRSKKSIGKMFFTIGIGVAVVAAVILVINMIISQNMMGAITVPDLTGMELKNAEETLLEAGLSASVQEEYSFVPHGVVIDQNPAPQKMVESGSVITIVISKGQATDVMPDVTNIPLEKARELLNNAGIQIAGTMGDTEGEISIGYVMKQTPAAGEPVNDDGVYLTVKVSPDEYKRKVPYLVGEMLDSALTVLQENGFIKCFIYEEEADAPAGTVIAQSPEANTEQLIEQPIGLTVSSLNNTTYIYSGSVDLSASEDKTVVKIGIQDNIAGFQVYHILTEVVLEAGSHEIIIDAVPVHLAGEQSTMERQMTVFVNDVATLSQTVILERAGDETSGVGS